MIEFNIPSSSRSVFCFQQPLSGQYLHICKHASGWNYSGAFTINVGEEWVVKTVNTSLHEVLVGLWY